MASKSTRREVGAEAVSVRWSIGRDLAGILAIERASFDHPWTEADFTNCLRQRSHICMVAERGDKVVGFMVYELHRDRLSLLNFAVAPDARREGIGAALAAKLKYKVHGHRREKVTMCVRESNLAAQVFFRSHGFEAVAVERGYYEDGGEDGYQMQYRPAAEEWAAEGYEAAPVNRIAGFR